MVVNGHTHSLTHSLAHFGHVSKIVFAAQSLSSYMSFSDHFLHYLAYYFNKPLVRAVDK